MIVTSDLNDLVEEANGFLEKAYKLEDPQLIRDSLLCYTCVFRSLSNYNNRKFDELVDVFDTYIRNIKLWDYVCLFNKDLEHNHIIDNNEAILKYIMSNYSEKEVNGSSLPNEEIFKILDGFYKNFDKEIYKIFKRIYNSDDNTLLLTKSEYVEDNTYDDGITIATNGLDKRMIIVYNHNDLRTLITLIHEFGHMISSYNNKISREDFEPYSEIESLFPEFVQLYERVSNYGDIVSCYHLINNLANNLEGVDSIAKQDELLKLWRTNHYHVNNSFDELLKQHNISKRKFNSIVENNFYNEALYAIGMIKVLKLLSIYRDEKKDALNLYKQIILGSRKKQADALKIIEDVDSIKEIENIHNDVLLVLNKRH